MWFLFIRPKDQKFGFQGFKTKWFKMRKIGGLRGPVRRVPLSRMDQPVTCQIHSIPFQTN